MRRDLIPTTDLEALVGHLPDPELKAAYCLSFRKVRLIPLLLGHYRSSTLWKPDRQKAGPTRLFGTAAASGFPV